MMVRYTAEQKEQALTRMAEIGAKKTQQELGISLQTLYQWRRKAAPAVKTAEPVEASDDAAVKPVVRRRARKANPALTEARALLKKDDGLNAKVRQLEAENAALRETNAKLKRVLQMLMD